MEGTTIEVCGVPDILPDERMVDKLTIHFLRPRNGGGEIIRVIYPTSTKGQAFVAFELQEVASQVTQLKHTLEIKGEQFPLTVGIADRLEVDLPVQATLDLRMFPDHLEVYGLLRKHKFKVTELSPGMVLLEGTFLNLRAVRFLLQRRLQEAVLQSCRGRSASVSALVPNYNGFDAAYEGQFYKDPGPSSRSRTLPLANGPQSYEDWSDHSIARSPSPVYESPRSLTMNRSSLRDFDSSSASSDRSLLSPYSWQLRESPRQQSYLTDDSGPQSLPNFPTQNLTKKPPLQRKVSSQKETTFPVDVDVFRYTWSFRKTEVDTVLQLFGTESFVSENSGVVSLTLKGRECEKAKDRLQNLFSDVHSLLREQRIPLTDLSHSKQPQVVSQLMKLKDVYKVLIKQTDDFILIIGSSSDSYAVKQLALGKEEDVSTTRGRSGRSTERNPRAQRSLSLPKQARLRSDEDCGKRVEASAMASLPSTYCPSRYQEDEKQGGTFIGVYRRSNSESRDRERAQRPVPKTESEHLASSSGSKMPKVKSALGFISKVTFKDKSKDKKSK